MNFLVFLTICAIFSTADSKSNPARLHVLCKNVSEEMLLKTLGAAFNFRYMSIQNPYSMNENNINKRSRENPSFYVEEDYTREFGTEAAWEVTNHLEASIKYLEEFSSGQRVVRQAPDYYPDEWHCKSELTWVDLGPDYFPRYLKTVICQQKKCWYDLYVCKPKSFTVKVMKRVEHCQDESGNLYEEIDENITTYFEKWIWEERAVNFCCECRHDRKSATFDEIRRAQAFAVLHTKTRKLEEN